MIPSNRTATHPLAKVGIHSLTRHPHESGDPMFQWVSKLQIPTAVRMAAVFEEHSIQSYVIVTWPNRRKTFH